ncbi:hypothetical protein D3C76_689650 [compost metagenome]
MLHGGLGASAQGSDLFGIDQTTLLHAPAQVIEGIALAPGLFLFLAAVAERAAGEGAVLVEEAVDVGLDDGRPLAGAHVRQCLLHRQVDGQRVHAVDTPAGNVEGRAARGESWFGGGFLDRGRYRVTVVLDEEAQRQLPGGREVHGFQHRTDVYRAVAEVAHRHGIGAGMPVGPGGACSQRHAATDDGVGAEHTGLLPAQVHGAATAAAEAVSQAENLGQRALQQVLDLAAQRRQGIDAGRIQVAEGLGQELMVPAMGAIDLVSRDQRHDGAGGAAFLADAGMRRTVDQTFRGQLQHAFLEGADQVHVCQQRAEHGRVGVFPVLFGGAQLHPRCRGRQRNMFCHGVLLWSQM